MDTLLSKNLIGNNNSYYGQTNNNKVCDLVLTQDDIQMIRSSWKIIAKDDGLAKHGAEMMTR